MSREAPILGVCGGCVVIAAGMLHSAKKQKTAQVFTVKARLRFERLKMDAVFVTMLHKRAVPEQKKLANAVLCTGAAFKVWGFCRYVPLHPALRVSVWTAAAVGQHYSSIYR